MARTFLCIIFAALLCGSRRVIGDLTTTCFCILQGVSIKPDLLCCCGSLCRWDTPFTREHYRSWQRRHSCAEFLSRCSREGFSNCLVCKSSMCAEKCQFLAIAAVRFFPFSMWRVSKNLGIFLLSVLSYDFLQNFTFSLKKVAYSSKINRDFVNTTDFL